MIRCNQILEPDPRALDPEPFVCAGQATHYRCGSKDLPICGDCLDTYRLTEDWPEIEASLVPIPPEELHLAH